MSQLRSHSANGNVIALTNQKGGVVKTTTAVWLGGGPAKQGRNKSYPTYNNPEYTQIHHYKK